jgi:hypothetical protein
VIQDLIGRSSEGAAAMFFSIKLYPLRIVFAVLTVLCMVGIFMFSTDNSDASSDKSGTITETAVEVFVKDYDSYSPDKKLDIFNEAEHIIRKIAHFAIFSALGFCASMTAGKRRLFSKKSGLVLVFCFLYACTDEFHQYFVPGRSSQFTDVLIDTGGALAGMLASLMITWIVSKIVKKKSEE